MCCSADKEEKATQLGNVKKGADQKPLSQNVGKQIYQLLLSDDILFHNAAKMSGPKQTVKWNTRMKITLDVVCTAEWPYLSSTKLKMLLFL